jgi:hypothetical protein
MGFDLRELQRIMRADPHETRKPGKAAQRAFSGMLKMATGAVVARLSKYPPPLKKPPQAP